MVRRHDSILERLASKAIELGADALGIEYKDRYEHVFAVRGGIGQGIARFLSSSRDGAALSNELYAVAKRKRYVIINNRRYELRGHIYESFGEDAFWVELRCL